MGNAIENLVALKVFRQSKDNVERRRLWAEMIAIVDSIPIPEGILGLPTEIFQPYEDLPAMGTAFK